MDEELSNKNAISLVYGNIASVYKYQGDYANALEYAFKALKIDEEIGVKKDMANDLCNIGECYLFIVEDTPAAPKNKGNNTNEFAKRKYQASGAADIPAFAKPLQTPNGVTRFPIIRGIVSPSRCSDRYLGRTCCASTKDRSRNQAL